MNEALVLERVSLPRAGAGASGGMSQAFVLEPVFSRRENAGAGARVGGAA